MAATRAPHAAHEAGGLIPAGMLWRNRFSVLLIDLRCTGGEVITEHCPPSTLGNQEYLDVLGAWDWLVEVQGYASEHIGIFGNSLGGTTALYAFSEEARVAALFLQSTYADTPEIISSEVRRHGYPAFSAPGAFFMGRVISGDDLVAHDPISAIQQAAGRPVYIVHSHADTRIAIEQSLQLAAAAEKAGVELTTWFPEKSEHALTPTVYPVEFEQRLVGFFRDTLRR